MDWLLFTRLGVVNIVGFVGLVLAVLSGWATVVVEKDVSYLSILVTAAFAYSLYLTITVGFLLSKELNRADKHPTRYGHADKMQSRLAARLSTIADIRDSTVMLGQIGTVVGFVMALSGLEANGAPDPSQMTTLFAQMGASMGVALFPTLVGGIFYVWIGINYRIVANGATKLMSKLKQ